MSKANQKTYWKDPRTLLDTLPFDQLNVCVDGILLVQASTTPDPTFSPTDNLVAANSTIALASVPGATIYYTINGTPPTTSSPKYSTPIPIGAVGTPAVTIQAFAMASNQSPSHTVTGKFTPANVALSPIFGACPADNKSVTLGPGTPNDTVYYTIDGTSPSRSSSSLTTQTPVSFSNPAHPIQAFEVGKTTARSGLVSKSCP